MKTILNSLIWKFGSLACLLAMLTALISVNNTCCFTAYQPDVPENL